MKRIVNGLSTDGIGWSARRRWPTTPGVCDRDRRAGEDVVDVVGVEHERDLPGWQPEQQRTGPVPLTQALALLHSRPVQVEPLGHPDDR